MDAQSLRNPMKPSKIIVATALSLACVLPTKGALVISELVFNEVGSDTTGEWIEIFNNGGLSLDLSNHKIGDEETSGSTGTGEHMVQFPAGASIGSGEVQIVAVSASRFFDVYGFLPTYEITNSNPAVPDMFTYSAWDPDGGLMAMANGNDQAFILDANDLLVDAVNWGNNFFLNPGLAQPVADGRSYQRYNVYVDTDTAADWILGPDSTIAAERSTPGIALVPEPTTWAMMLIGLGGITAVVRRRK